MEGGPVTDAISLVLFSGAGTLPTTVRTGPYMASVTTIMTLWTRKRIREPQPERGPGPGPGAHGLGQGLVKGRIIAKRGEVGHHGPRRGWGRHGQGYDQGQGIGQSPHHHVAWRPPVVPTRCTPPVNHVTIVSGVSLALLGAKTAANTRSIQVRGACGVEHPYSTSSSATKITSPL